MSFHAVNRQKYLTSFKIHSLATKILSIRLCFFPCSCSERNNFLHVLVLRCLRSSLQFVSFFILLILSLVRVSSSGNKALREIICILQLILLHCLSSAVRKETCPSSLLPTCLSFTASEEKKFNEECQFWKYEASQSKLFLMKLSQEN